MNKYAGLSAYICIGRYGGIGWRKDGPSIRLTLGWISFGIVWRDIERQRAAMGAALDKYLPKQEQA